MNSWSHRLHVLVNVPVLSGMFCVECGVVFADEAIEDGRIKPCRRRRLPEPTVHVDRPYTKADWRAELSTESCCARCGNPLGNPTMMSSATKLLYHPRCWTPYTATKATVSTVRERR